MLPILRVFPVGGVLLAIAILLLALNPPDGSRAHLTGSFVPAHGALLARELHPEWRQLLMLAALRRADELNRLRQLPDATVVVLPPMRPSPSPKAPEVAAVPKDGNAGGSDDATGSISQTPDATMPVDIGETSSTELPVMPHKELPPVVTPQRADRPDQTAAPATSTPPSPGAPQSAAPAKAAPSPAPGVREAKTTLEPAKPPAAKTEHEIKAEAEHPKPRARRVRRIRTVKRQANPGDIFPPLFGNTSGPAPTPDSNY